MAIIRQFGDSIYLVNTNLSSNTIVYNTSSVERMRIDQNGNIGIGTTFPTSALHVQGNVVVSGDMLQGGLSTRAFAIAMSTALSI